MALRILMKPGAMHAECKRRDISRDALSRIMGVASTTAYKVEKRSVDPSPKFIAALILATGKPFEDLFEIDATGADIVPQPEGAIA